MIRLKLTVAVLSILLFSTPPARAQNSRIAVVDFERAVVASVEGKKSSDKFNAEFQARQNDIEKKKKELDDQQKKLQNGARTLSDVAKADIQKDIDRRTTELQRINEDAQKELQALRDELLRPIAQRATAILNAMAEAQSYTVVIDVSNPENNVLWFNPKNDITADLVRRIDAETPKTEPAKTEAPKTPAPTTARPTTPAPTPRPATQPPAPATPKP